MYTTRGLSLDQSPTIFNILSLCLKNFPAFYTLSIQKDLEETGEDKVTFSRTQSRAVTATSSEKTAEICPAARSVVPQPRPPCPSVSALLLRVLVTTSFWHKHTQGQPHNAGGCFCSLLFTYIASVFPLGLLQRLFCCFILLLCSP